MQIAFLLLDRMLGSSCWLPAEIFNAAAQHCRSRSGQRRTAVPQLRFASMDGGDVRTASGLPLAANCQLAQLREPDILLLPALWRNPMPALRAHGAAIAEVLRRLGDGPTLLCAVGTGSFLLAESGLLDRCPATTHWHHFETFERRYPQVQLRRRHLLTQAGQLYCAGSINAVADLAIHLASRYYGRSSAQTAEQHFSPESRRSFDHQAYLYEPHGTHHDEDIAHVQDWLGTDPGRHWAADELARRIGISTRHFQRRFRQATGTTPHRYLWRQRIELGRELLRESNLPLREIAARCGSATPAHFTTRFRLDNGMTPGAYRRLVRGKLFSAEPQKPYHAKRPATRFSATEDQ